MWFPTNLLAGLAAMFATYAAIAAEGVATNAPVETVSTIWVVVFGLVFIGFIAAFFFMIWWGEKKKRTAAKH